jgi:catalase
VGPRLGRVGSASGPDLEADASLENAPSVTFDAVVLPPGAGAMAALLDDGRAVEFVRDQYRHCKPIYAIGDGADALDAFGIPVDLADGTADPGIVIGDDARGIDRFVAAIAAHRHFARETNPPRV